MRIFADSLARTIARETGLAPEDVRVEQPRDLALGDLAFPCFALAKSRGKSPVAIAAELAPKLAAGLAADVATGGVSAQATGPYVNFRIERSVLARTVLGEIEAAGAGYGNSTLGAGKTVVVDFSSPNIAKPMHVGHLRSTILGQAIVRLHQALGYRTVGINHIGDWGSQFGALVVAIRRWRDTVSFDTEPVRALLELYQRGKRASDPESADHDPAFAAEARAAWQELESGREGEVRSLWRWITEVSLRGFSATYARLGIVHDLVRGESFYEPFLADAFRRAEQAGITEVSDGALIVDLKGIDKGLAETPCLLRQRDGTTLYATRDLAALFHRWEEFRFERCLYVVGGEQKLHFRQLVAVLRRLGLEWQPRVEHIDFGLLLGPGRTKLASRKGDVLVLDELLDEVVEEARAVVRQKNPDNPRIDEIAEQVGIGAIVFNDLKRERIKDVLFDKAEILSFEGDTGPYVQYTHARLGSILRKADEPQAAGAPDWTALSEAGAVLIALARFPDVVRSAAGHCEPSELSQYLLALCRELNNWYVANRVLGQEPGVTRARLALVRASKRVIHNGLGLLGAAAPEAM